KGPLLTLSWDEAHVLTEKQFKDPKRSSKWTQFNEFRRIDQVSPHSRYDPSQRIEGGALQLPDPFINLGFDQFARDKVDPIIGFNLSDAVKTEWMVQFGRPLDDMRKRIVDFAQEKLLCSEIPKAHYLPTREEILAIMGLRLGLTLDAHNRSEADVAKQLVERHLRVVMQMTTNSSTIRTIAPSEPILAEASFRLMRSLKTLKCHPAQALHQVIGDSLHAKGERGEIIATLLLLLARDAVAERKDSARILVTDFLVELLGNQ
ncbi:5662_t:CDS:2, partial [Acaulospora colombiana]